MEPTNSVIEFTPAPPSPTIQETIDAIKSCTDALRALPEKPDCYTGGDAIVDMRQECEDGLLNCIRSASGRLAAACATLRIGDPLKDIAPEMMSVHSNP